MNTILSFNRFQYYMLRKVMYSKSQYIYTLLTVVSVYLLALCMQLLFGFAPAPLIKGAILVTIIISPCLFEPTIRKYNGVMEYTLPVSTFERFLYLAVKYIILIPLITLGTYQLLNLIMSYLPVNGIYEFCNNMEFSSVTLTKLYVLLGFQSIYMVGELSFKQNSILKTTLILIVGSIVISTLFVFILSNKFMNLDMQSPDVFPQMMLSMDVDNFKWRLNLLKGIHIIFPVVMWTVSFFRIREREI